MRRLYLRAAAVMGLTLVVSATVYGVLIEREWAAHGGGALHPELEAALQRAWTMSTLLDVLIIAVATFVLVAPVYARLHRVHRAARRIQAGERGVRVGLSGRDILAELGLSFDSMAAATEQQLDNQRALMRAVSHELRTPIARLRFALEELASASPEERDARRMGAERDIEELDALVEEVLLYSRASPGGAAQEPRSIDLAEDVRGLAPALEEQGPSIEVSGPSSLPLEGEPRLLRRAVQNLLVNAQRHARERVRLELEEGDERVRLTVDDDGPGVAPELRERLFEPFVRGRARGDGHGLGLAIARAVARRHGGDVILEEGSGPLGGARFTLWLPRGSSSVRSRAS